MFEGYQTVQRGVAAELCYSSPQRENCVAPFPGPPRDGCAGKNGGRLRDLLRGDSEYSARDILHHRIPSRKVLVLKSQGLRETSPIGMSDDPLRRIRHRWRWCSYVRGTGQWSLTRKSGKTDHSKWAVIPGIQKVRSRTDDVPGTGRRCACAAIVSELSIPKNMLGIKTPEKGVWWS
jgi:hypothetical protein